MRRLGRIALLVGLPVFLLAGIVYFNAQSFTGRYGSLASEQVTGDHRAMQREIDRLEETLSARRLRNEGLRAGSTNLDLLDERARAELGMLRIDEVFLVEE